MSIIIYVCFWYKHVFIYIIVHEYEFNICHAAGGMLNIYSNNKALDQQLFSEQ